MRRFLVAALFYISALAGQPSNRQLFEEIDSTLAELSSITGLKVQSRVERDFITKEKLKAFLETRIAETVKPEELRIEELTLKLFGFVPESYDLKSSTINLLTEQAAAFYDYRKKKMFLLESAPEVSQRFVLIHELAHALADQHFALEKFIRAGKNDDSATARMAVMEGQAQWLMYEVITKKGGSSLRKDPGMVRMMVNLSGAGLSEYPELSGAPLYIRESLLFPYTRGLLFQQAVVDKLGDSGFAEVFRNPPRSSREVIHPEVYFERPRAVVPKLPKAKSEYNAVADGDLGEFDILILLSQFADDETAKTLAPEWRAGRYRVLERKGSKEPALQFTVTFADAASAGRFAAVYREKVLPKKPRPGQVTHQEKRVDVVEGLK